MKTQNMRYEAKNAELTDFIVPELDSSTWALIFPVRSGRIKRN